MNNLDFTFEESPLELLLASFQEADVISAARFLALMEEETEETVEDALQELEAWKIRLDISELPKASGTGEAALRLRREEQLVQQGTLPAALEENDPLRLYLEELAAIPVCGDPQVLALECLEGKTGAEERLLNLSLGRVVELAMKHTGRGVLLLDLIQEGSLGLWQAIAGYRGGDFEAHSRWYMEQYMAKAVCMQARANGVGQRMRQALEDYKAVDERLLSELGRNATIEEIAEEMHMHADETALVKSMLDSARLMSRAKADQEPEEESPEDEQHVEDTALFQMRQRIADLLADLSEDDSKLLTLRFGLEGGLPLTPEETGRKMGLTPEEVVALEAAALARLRNS